MGKAFIQTRDLTKKYFTEEVETTALQNINLSIEKGEFVAVTGPSGCGKTTLLNLLGFIDRPTSGSFTLNGYSSASLSDKKMTRTRRDHLGFVFQNYNLVEELNVGENVELPLIFAGVKRKVRKEKVARILEDLKLGHRKQHYPQQLSGGQQQRVAFARAIVNEPRLILADEPTGNLDSRNGTMIMDLLTDYNRRGSTVIMVTHSQKGASYAHRTLKLLDGALIY